MRRTLALLACTSIVFAACGSDDADSGGQAVTEAPAETSDDDGSDGGSTDTGSTDTGTVDTGTGETGSGAASTEAAGSDGAGAADEEVPPAPTNPDKPAVETPDEVLTELEVTVLQEGAGPEAELGDTVIVDYVGVRSSDGVEFDNSYDRFQPFPVELGTGSVIAGWDEGLTGVQTGQRVQLDIPSDLAYGADGRGDLIGPDEALTFVVDVRAVIPKVDLADQPTEAGVPASEGATSVESVDLIDGDGATLEEGDVAVFHFVLFRGDNLAALRSTWEQDATQLQMIEGEFAGLVEGMPGMKVGGRRAVVIPPESGFGVEGSGEIGLPPETDIILVVDLLGKY